MCALGITPCINQLGSAALQIMLNNTLRYYGAASIYGSEIPLACVGAVSKLHLIFMAFTMGIGQGCQPIHGFNYGAKQYKRVKQTLLLAILSASIISLIAFAAFQIFPRPLMLIFGENDPLYLEFATRYLRIFMFMIFLSGIQPVAATFFPAIGKGGHGTLISLSRQVIFIIPLLLILPAIFGVNGAVYSGPISDFAAACVSATLIVRELRRLSVVEPH
jgi:Na+-driven multidrug efflux pump